MNYLFVDGAVMIERGGRGRRRGRMNAGSNNVPHHTPD